MATKTVSTLKSRKAADALILPFFEGSKPAFSGKEMHRHFEKSLKAGDFKGKKEEMLALYPSSGKEKRLILIGLGKEKDLTKETLRRSYAKAIGWLKGKGKSVNVCAPDTDLEDAVEAICEGVFLTMYTFDAYKSEKEKTVTSATFIGADSKIVKKTEKIAECVYFARDLSFGNADQVTPTFLCEEARALAVEFKEVKVTTLDRKEIVKQKLGLLEAVSKGASEEPALIIMDYRGDPKSKECHGLVGKGITFDTGGLNLKPTNFIEDMRCDMSGAAAVLGTMHAVCALKLPINIVGVIASTENAIGSKAYKPGDVYTSYAGITVEITNTDAEGRLVLADALSYLQKKYSPKRIINIATLTGGAVISLGEEVSALMSNDETISEELIEAGESTYERVWPLPLYDEYNSILKSKNADMKNSGARKASAIQGGIFLKKFIEKTKWAHIDIAGTAHPDEQKPYHPVSSTGVGVRLFTKYFENLCKCEPTEST